MKLLCASVPWMRENASRKSYSIKYFCKNGMNCACSLVKPKKKNSSPENESKDTGGQHRNYTQRDYSFHSFEYKLSTEYSHSKEWGSTVQTVNEAVRFVCLALIHTQAHTKLAFVWIFFCHRKRLRLQPVEIQTYNSQATDWNVLLWMP